MKDTSDTIPDLRHQIDLDPLKDEATVAGLAVDAVAAAISGNYSNLDMQIAGLEGMEHEARRESALRTLHMLYDFIAQVLPRHGYHVDQKGHRDGPKGKYDFKTALLVRALGIIQMPEGRFYERETYLGEESRLYYPIGYSIDDDKADVLLINADTSDADGFGSNYYVRNKLARVTMRSQDIETMLRTRAKNLSAQISPEEMSALTYKDGTYRLPQEGTGMFEIHTYGKGKKVIKKRVSRVRNGGNVAVGSDFHIVNPEELMDIDLAGYNIFENLTELAVAFDGQEKFKEIVAKRLSAE